MEQYNKVWLTEKYQKNEELNYLFFWGHQPAKDGTITQSCFSQWWEASFLLEDKYYHTAEHWMMAQKALLFFDNDIADKILMAKSPVEVKKLGRLVRNFNPEVWDQNKFEIVVKGNYHKFQQNHLLKQFILQTKDRILVEASPVDPVWGIGLAANDDRCQNPLLWQGDNLLGFALMEVRDMLR